MERASVTVKSGGGETARMYYLCLYADINYQMY